MRSTPEFRAVGRIGIAGEIWIEPSKLKLVAGVYETTWAHPKLGWPLRSPACERMAYSGASFLDSLLHAEIELVQVDGVRRPRRVSVELVVDCDPVPAGCARHFVMVEGGCVSIKRNRLEQQLIIRGSLDADDEMVPRPTHRVAGNSSGHPFFMNIVIHVPLVPASDSALMPPNERESARKLIDVEFHCL